MTTAAKRAPISPARRGLLAKIHMAAKDLALAEVSYRDLLERETGKRSAADCSEDQLDKAIKAFEALGWKPKRKGRRGRKQAAGPGLAWPAGPTPSESVRPLLGKARALWRALHDLGVVRDAGDPALAAFVRRQTRIEALEWLTPGEAYKVIEALKAMCKRAGFEVPAGGLEAKKALLRALWARLHALGAVDDPHLWALDAWVTRVVSPHDTTVAQLDAGQCDKAAERLGRWVRQATKEGEDAT